MLLSTRLDLLDALPDHAAALPDFLQPNQEAIKIIAGGPDRHVEIKSVIDQIGIDATDVIGCATRAQQGAGTTKGDQILARKNSCVLHAFAEDRVGQQQVLEVLLQTLDLVKPTLANLHLFDSIRCGILVAHRRLSMTTEIGCQCTMSVHSPARSPRAWGT